MRVSIGFRFAKQAIVIPSVLAAVTAACVVWAQSAPADEFVSSCGSEPNGVFRASSAYGMFTQASCPGSGLLIQANASFQQGQGAIWQAVAPEGLTITAAWVTGLQSIFVNQGSTGDYGGNFYWNGGTSDVTPNESSAVFDGLSSSDFGFVLVCGRANCGGASDADIDVAGVVLTVHETTGPALSAPSGLWQSSGWIRGTWTLSFAGDSPSGMCSLGAQLAGQSLPGSSSTPVSWQWHQCAAAPVNDPVYTSAYPQGADTLQIGGTDAAGIPAALTRTVDIDNQPPTISLTGPTDAPSTAGTQYVTATATAGPSGVAGISCSVDGAAAQWYPASTAQVPVNGIGEHQVQCFSENNAVDATGNRAGSQPATFAMKIGTPTVAAVAFSKLVDALRCHRTTERVRIPARWVTVKIHGHPVRAREPAHTTHVRITHCHARTARRTVTVWVKTHRDGKTVRVRRRKTERVLLTPHLVYGTRRVVGFGKPTAVDGWLGTTSGVALGGQTVDVLTAPNSDPAGVHVAAVATTAADGGWSTQLPAGPSRVVTASYGGASTTESAVSTPVSLIVPAKIKLLSVSPRRVAWGGTIRLDGQLKGGYLPPGGALVRLRIGEGSAVTTYGIREHVRGKGRFSTTYTFGAGDPATYRSFWFQIASLPMGNYPYAPANSRRLSVTVGGHPPVPVRRKHR